MSADEAKAIRDKARDLQRTVYRAAKASPERRFHALYDKVYREDVLAAAWQEVKTNAGAAGVDQRTIEQIEQAGVEGFLAELASDLRTDRYRAQWVRRVRIPKADGKQRPLGIPMIASYYLSRRNSPESSVQVMRVLNPFSACGFDVGRERNA